MSANGVELESSKIQAMLNWPVSIFLRSLCWFLGLTGFYQCFVKNYTQLASHMTHLLCKDKFKWSPEALTTFDNLNLPMTQTLILTLPDFNIPFVFETDASVLDWESFLCNGIT